jgi:1,4-alpha-glucan branching enzyme
MRLASMPYVVSAWVAAALAAVTSASCATMRPPEAPAITPSGVRFVLVRPDARSVAVAGTFNQWSASSDLLTREPHGGTWTIVLQLPPGEHRFMYVVDGSRWISPPVAADFVADGFGSMNGVVIVPPNER